ncbi:hypothetical protein [Rhizobium sp. BK602]|uniref:phage major tropism determinant n=1 Tax=Rhizobium sp. BK602 TaxID=2586986 RepID=UPI00160FC168|nr:hypothetical protein [Rhizobium sp. BK602]MBB3608627.1 hypothetical protein [Rhizobium sp. BK602]
MTAAAEVNRIIRIESQDWTKSILVTPDRTSLYISAGTAVEIDGTIHRFDNDTPIALGNLDAGKDYAVTIDAAGQLIVEDVSRKNPLTAGYFAGFHFAPGGHATGTAGGDAIPEINPYSLWNIGFGPACPDPRGMALIDMGNGRRFWADIYLLGINHHEHGTSRFGATIADGEDLPLRPDGSTYGKLDFTTAKEIYAHHDKHLLSAEEFFTAAYGVRERCSRDGEPRTTGSFNGGGERFISRYGLFDATGTMWQWGTDGHPDDPRPSVFGGSWINGSSAGSRCAYLAYWPEDSAGSISARGGSDHMAPA